MKYHVDFEIEFRRNPYKGLYIALEGIDGSGKTTQAAELAFYFKKKGKKVVLTREPRKEGIIGDIVQQILTRKIKVPSEALQYLFTTDRVLHHEELVLPALKQGKVVISDRCFWSALAYGILDRTNAVYDDKSANFLLIANSILSMYHQFVVPDYVFCLMVNLQTALSRIRKKDDIKEIYEDTEKLRKVIEGYGWLAKKFPKEITAVNGKGRVGGVTKEMVGHIQKTQNTQLVGEIG